MARVVLVGYGAMLYSLIEGVKSSKNEILGVFRIDRIRYNEFELFFKDIFAPSKDYTIIKSEKLHDIKAKSVNSKEFIKEIKKLKPDLIIVGSWGEKFREEILNLIPCVNFHPALLPKNRGANPYFWTIYKNQKVTGLTIHFMNKDFDKGDIILQEAIEISDTETGKTLKEKTVKLAKPMVIKFLELFNTKQIQPIVQDEKYASYEPQLTQNELLIDLNKPKEDVQRHLRALYPWASPYVRIGNFYVKFDRYEFSDITKDKKKIGEIITSTKKYTVVKGSNFDLKIYK